MPIFLYFQVSVYLGLADHVWPDKRKAITLSVDFIGDQFRPVMRAGWLSYIRNNYPEEDGGVTAGPAVGEGTLVVGTMSEVVQLLLLPNQCRCDEYSPELQFQVLKKSWVQ